MPALLNQFKTDLKKQGLSLTEPRLLLFKILGLKQALTINQIVLKASPKIDRATVYRNIKLFERLGIVQRIQIGFKYRLELSDRYLNHHHHLTCRSCQQTVDLNEDKILEERLSQLTTSAGWQMDSHHLEIQGLCPACLIKLRDRSSSSGSGRSYGSLTLPNYKD